MGNKRSDPDHTAASGTNPLEASFALRHQPGLVFLDSAGNAPASASPPWSWVTSDPKEIIRGSIHETTDRERLRAILAKGAASSPRGGLFGWVEYEGTFVFGLYPDAHVFDHSSQSWLGDPPPLPSIEETTDLPIVIGNFTASTTRETFTDNVRRIREWIAAGDIYQANLSQAFTAPVSGGSLFPLYRHLRAASPAPMAAYLFLDGREILSSSPELFLKIRGRDVETRPIKGTRPRFPDPDTDRRSAFDLQTSPKEIAELVMITDLLRNDLGQVCTFGSISVSEMLRLESLAQVHHLVSTVRGTLNPTTDAIDALAASFPGGSITGAPKKRAMEIIRELEQQPRGIYCGAIGRIGFNGDADFNIAIRTLVRHDDRLIYQVGAGIVADSDPELEYQETLHKAAGIRLAIEAERSSGAADRVR